MRKHNYVVGYRGEGQCIYGKGKGLIDWIDPLTLNQAKKLFNKEMMDWGAKLSIYKLVEVKK